MRTDEDEEPVDRVELAAEMVELVSPNVMPLGMLMLIIPFGIIPAMPPVGIPPIMPFGIIPAIPPFGIIPAIPLIGSWTFMPGAGMPQRLGASSGSFQAYPFPRAS